MKIDGDKVRALREMKSWSQEHLASASGLSVRTVQRVEKEGGSLPETRLALAAALGVDAAELAGGTAARKPASDQAARLQSGIRKGWTGWGLGFAGATAGILVGYFNGAPLADTMRGLGIMTSLAGITAGLIGVLAERARQRQINN
jgi:transcriptional regulator with XRE-family HTH domain